MSSKKTERTTKTRVAKVAVVDWATAAEAKAVVDWGAADWEAVDSAEGLEKVAVDSHQRCYTPSRRYKYLSQRTFGGS